MRRNDVTLQTRGGVHRIKLTLKHAMRENPKTVIYNENGYK